MNYANKTCYDCGVKNPANMMERVNESYNSGRSDNTVTAGNLAFAMVSDTAAKKVKRTVVANNRRSYTRNRSVWKCLDCSGHNAALANIKYAEDKETLRKSKGEMKTFGKFVWWSMFVISSMVLYAVVAEAVGGKPVPSDEYSMVATVGALWLVSIHLLFNKPRKAKKRLSY